MQKSVLEVYLEKVAAGEQGFTDKLCAQLADRLCYVPALAVDTEDAHTKIEVLKINRGESPFVPLFTQERRFRSWAQSIDKKVEPISLLGGDLCAVLGDTTGVLVDPGSDHSVELNPQIVAEIARQVAVGQSQDSSFGNELNSSDPFPDQEIVESELPTNSAASKPAFDPFNVNLAGHDSSVASELSAESSFEAHAPTQLLSDELPATALSAYEDLMQEIGAKKTQVVAPLLQADTILSVEPEPPETPEKKSSLFGLLRRVVGKKE